MGHRSSPMDTLENGFQLAHLRVVPLENCVFDRHMRVELEPRVMKLLVLLCRHQGKVLGRDRLLDEIWNDVRVQEDSLTKAISELRRILADDPRSPRFVRTIRKGGYQLIADIQPLVGGPASGGGSMDFRWALLAAAAVVFVAVAVLLTKLLVDSRQDDVSARFEGLQITRLTSFAGQEMDPHLSPDGLKIVFVRNSDDTRHDLFVKSLNSPRLLRLTDSAAEDRFPRWSPKGDQIAFLRIGPDETSVMAIPSLGGEARELARVPFTSMGLDWSRDGRRLYFSSKTREADPFRLTQFQFDGGIHSYLTNPPPSFDGDRSPNVEPSGDRVGFIRHNRQGEVQFMLLDGDGRERLLHEEQGANLSFSWNRLESGLFLDRLEGARYVVRYLDLASGVISALDGISGWTMFPTAHHRLPRMVFLEFAVRRDVMRVDLLSDPIALTPLIASTQLDFDAHYSHRGDRIAFISSQGGDMQLFIADADGQTRAQLTHFEGASLNTPAWSADDNQIALQVNRQGRNTIVLVDVGQMTIEPLIDDEYINVKPSWSVDGSTIYFGSNRSGDWQIWQKHMPGGEITRLTGGGGRIAKPGANGRYLFFTRQEQVGLWRLDLSSGEESLIIKDLGRSDLNNWVVETDGLVYVRRDAEEAVVYRRRQHVDQRLLILPHLSNVGIGLSSDGRHLLYTAMPPPESDVMLAEWAPR